MNENNPLEKQLQTWIPRHPSDKIAARLFGGDLRPAALVRRTEFWNWLTPAAACALTLLVVVGGANHRFARFENKDSAPFFATMMFNADAASNSQQTIFLSKKDVNLEWNVWSHASPSHVDGWIRVVTNR
jgi:hypothetical protein